jgi:hypothetical protein
MPPGGMVAFLLLVCYGCDVCGWLGVGICDVGFQECDRLQLINQARTWELCNAFKVTNPEPDYIVGRGEDGKIITNYAENIAF